MGFSPPASSPGNDPQGPPASSSSIFIQSPPVFEPEAVAGAVAAPLSGFQGMQQGPPQGSPRSESQQDMQEEMQTGPEKGKEAPTQVASPASAMSAFNEACAATASLENALDSLVNQLGNSSLTYDNGLRMMANLKSADIALRLEATQAYRRSLSSRQDGAVVNPAGATPIGALPSGTDVRSGPLLDICIDEFIDTCLVPHVVDSLRMPHPHLQLESILLLQRLCRGTFAQTLRVISSSLLDAVVDILKKLTLDSPGGVELRVAIFSFLTKLALDFKHEKDLSLVRRPLLLPAVLRCANLHPGVEAVRCVEALVHPRSCSADMKVAVLQFLVRVMSESTDPTSLSLACNACVTLCDSPEGVSAVLEAMAMPHIMKLLCHSDETVVFDALSIAARIAFIGTTQQIDQVIGMGTVSTMVKVLTDPAVASPMARARACNTIGNLGCETPAQVQAIIDTQAFPLLLEIFQVDPDYNTRIEAAYAVCACLSRASPQQVGVIVCCTTRVPSFMERGRGSSHVYFAQELDEPCVLSLTGSNPCLHLIADMLELVSQSDPSNSGSLKLCKAILRGLENILEVGVQEGKSLDLPENPYARLFQAVQGDIKLARMRYFPDYNVATKAHSILQYFTALSSRAIKA
ncbi:Importin subunit alpha, related [Eimeria tenella]|uniref:Importin subunit alpha, related n=1 Tax=Eimeria tenella TaxID=5802 RepID=U6KG31_EIMTE|nr:Importin subunit alpha, related [Eimeria tenella]CDJ36995.1 Importin subunit alpha, related [Eimeria tenella]|eukprot:XP_013227833.1 Importin subunit alpha, related [Eimeria tenella]